MWTLNETGDGERRTQRRRDRRNEAAAPEKLDVSDGKMDDFARELLKCDLSDLPVVRGELGDT
ncbi:MAG: hypothetical protein ACLRSW_03320 [Christensenellaceae bacterium]